ncbi:Ig-like domain-containing protein [Metapseudomonas otitidis]|uniref:Ig-like domain-containing protein n=1 Tax=Metapseudomonas otitidis TaxID=319939 RepID=UPI0024468171|nr:Ig-like domain-containing protein [Pseudomonas otitidis]MDG9783965.1 Ig-like domain-containing protein [Pseudomonas otitidis]
MSTSNASVHILHNGTTRRFEAPSATTAATTTQVMAQPGALYLLDTSSQGDTLLWPEMQRRGQDLELGTEQPWLVIQDFFSTPGTLGVRGHDGSHHIYVSAEALEARLDDGATLQFSPGPEPIATALLSATPFAHVPRPTLLNILDDIGTIQGSVAHLQATDDNRPTLQGTARPGDRILIKDGDRKLGETVTDDQGNWSFTPRTPLAEGRHDFTIQAQDPQGDLSEPSDVHSLIVDRTAPRRPSIDDLYDDQGQITGPIPQGGSTDDARPSISGTAEPLATVVVLDRGQEVGRTQALADGSWSLTPSIPLSQGIHSLTALAIDQAGNTSQPSDAFELQVLSAQPPAAPSIDELQDTAGRVTGSIPRDGLTDDPRPLVRGSATAGLKVTLYANGKAIGSAFADQNGQWSITPPAALESGAITLTAVAQSEAGNFSRESLPYGFKLTTGLPDTPQLLEIRDDAGLDHGPIADRQATDDARPTFIGKGAAGQRILIHDQGQLVGETRVDSRGNWRFTPKSNLAEGEHSFTITAMDATGATSITTPPHRLSIDTSPPARPQVIDLQDNQGDLTGSIALNGVTDDVQPILTGTGEPHATVRVYDNGREIGRTTIGANGQWTFEPTRPLELGEHILSARVFDQAGNASALSDLLPFTVLPGGQPQAPTITGVVDDQGSIVGPVSQGGETDDTLPLVRGIAEPNMVITLYANGSEVGRTTSNTSGQWSLEPSSPLPEGTIVFTAKATSPAGNTSTESNGYSIIIDITAPGLPELLDVIDDVGSIQGSVPHLGTTDDTLPTLVGSGQPGARVLIRDNGQPLGEATVDALGNWQFVPPYRLPEGTHTITILAVDAAGNRSQESPPRTLIVDTTAPDRPVILSVLDDQGDVTGPVLPGGITDDAQPLISGTAEAGATLVLYDNGIEIGRTLVESDGTWFFEPSSPLSGGAHSLTARAMDAAGNTSAASLPHGFTLVTGGRPLAPSIDDLIDDQGDLRGSIPSGGVTDDTQPQITGRGQPNTTLVLFDNGREIGRTTVEANGTWTFEPKSPLTTGPHALKAQVIDSAGNASPWSPDYTFTLVAAGQPNAPTIEGVYDDQGSIIGNVPRGGVTDDAQPQLNGKAPAHSTVTVKANGQIIGTTTADANGTWLLTPATPLADGPQTLTAQSTNTAGNTSAPSTDYVIVIDTIAPDTPSLQEVLDDVGPLQGPIPHQGITDDNRPTLTGNGQPGDRILIKDNGQVIGEVIVDSNGSWQYVPPKALTDGQHDFVLQAVDAAGNLSIESKPHTILVDTRAPDRPAIERVFDDQGSITGPIAQGGTTDDARPLISGTAEPLSTLVVYDAGREIARTQTDANGRWSVEPTLPLADGEHRLSAIAIDQAGNASLPSADHVFSVDTLAPARPVITQVFDDQGDVTGPLNPGDTTDDSRPLISGTAEANTTLVVFDNGVEIGRTLVDTNGQWTFEPSLPMPLGSHNLSAQSINAAGNTSLPSNAFAFTLASPSRPSSPTIESVYDDQGSIIGNVPRGGVTDDARPLIQGSAGAGLTVMVLANGKVIGSTVAGSDGKWSFEPGTDLADGLQNITAKAVSATGNLSLDSARYPIQVDTQAPASAKQKLMDDVGPVQGEITPGTVTDDNRPTFIGTAEPGSTIIIYDWGMEIGRTTAAGNGAWTFTPADALTDGLHSFSTQVQDIAGNRSDESAPLDFQVDTYVPQAVALISQMTKDSGTDTQDFRTNDGSAGRLVSGSVQGQLGFGERIQVSVDNGASWHDALDLGNGRWSYTDHTPHQSDWAIQTRVIDDAGRTGPVEIKNVVLDQWVTPPTDVSWANGVLTVSFNRGDFQVGSLIEATVDGTAISHRLSAQEIANGRANLSAPNAGTPPAVYGASMVDEVGNLSQQLTVSSALGLEQSFNAAGHYLPLFKDFSYDVGTMVITGERYDRNVLQGIFGPNYRNPTLLPISKPVLMVSDIVTLDLKVGSASRLQCNISENHFMSSLPPGEYDTTRFYGTFSLNFYNEQGTMVHSHSVQFNGRQFGESLDIRMLEGVTFSKVSLQVSSQYAINQSFITLDDIRFEVTSGDYTRLYEQNFDNTSHANLNSTNKAIDLGGFVIRDEGLRTTAQQGIFNGTWIENSYYKLSTPVTGSALFITEKVALELKSTTANRFTAKLGDLLGESVNLTFYDASGKAVHFLNLRNDKQDNTLHNIDVRLPSGQTFTQVKVQVFNDPGIDGKAPLIWLDELKFHGVSGEIGGTPSGSNTIELLPPPSEQSVQTAHPYYGGDSNDTFLLADIRVLNGPGASINGGEGMDCITLTGAGQVMDLTALAGKVRSIEVLDITGSGNNTLKLSAADVLSQGQTDLFRNSGHVQMLVKGDAGDLVQLQKLAGANDGGRWQSQGNVNVDGVGYQVWQHSSLEAELLIQMGVTTQLV